MIDDIRHKLTAHHLTGRAMGDNCTDGFDTEYVLLAQELYNLIKLYFKEGNEVFGMKMKIDETLNDNEIRLCDEQ